MTHDPPVKTEPSGQPPLDRTAEPTGWHLFLDRLHAEPGRREERYHELRGRLIRLFRSRHCRFPEDLADLAVHTAAFALAQGRAIDSLEPFLFGIARNILLRDYDGRTHVPVSLDELLDARKPVPAALQETAAATEEPRDSQCLQRCLDALSPEERAAVLAHYGTLHQRGKQAAKSSSARVQVFRIIDRKLRPCVTRCVQS